MSARAFWKNVRRLTAGGIDGYLRDKETARLQQEIAQLHSLATELRVPLPNAAGGYGEIVVQRLSLAADLWAVTDGANTKPRVWVDDDWRPLHDLGFTGAFRYTLAEALTVAHQVAEYEGAASEAQAQALSAPTAGEDGRG